MALPVSTSYAVLCVTQGVVAAVGWRPWRLRRGRIVGLLAPVAALGLGVIAIRGFEDGATVLTSSAVVVAPVGAALCGVVLRWRLGWWTALLAVAAFLVAWRIDGRLGDLASILLIAGACATAAGLVRATTPARLAALGLVALVALDVVLVFGFNDVQPATRALHATVPPSASLPGVGSRPLPALQDATYGTALMGWLDILAPAVLGLLFAGRARWRFAAAAATTAGALGWGLMFHVRSEIPATVPVLAGLVIWWLAEGRRPYTDLQ